MDLPGSNYVAEPLLPDSDRPGVEMKSIWAEMWYFLTTKYW
jgi:hypothetical protein